MNKQINLAIIAANVEEIDEAIRWGDTQEALGITQALLDSLPKPTDVNRLVVKVFIQPAINQQGQCNEPHKI